MGDCLLRQAASPEQLDGLLHSGAMQGRPDLQSPACGPHEGFPPLRMDELIKAPEYANCKVPAAAGTTAKCAFMPGP